MTPASANQALRCATTGHRRCFRISKSISNGPERTIGSSLRGIHEFDTTTEERRGGVRWQNRDVGFAEDLD